MMNTRKVVMLSKTRFLAGLQCPLRLWHGCYNPELAPGVSPVQQVIFDTGHQVGRLATELYPKGVLIVEDHLHHEEAVQKTIAAMGNPKVPAIYEAGFTYDGVRVRADILERLGNGRWNLIEVKSSTSEKEIYLPDVAVQHYVLKGSGLNIDRIILMNLNNQYVYDGRNIRLAQLFSKTDMTQKTILYQNQIPSLIRSFNEMLAKPEEPEIRPGRHCRNPYDCEFREYCTKDMPEHWVLNLSGITQRKLDDLAAMGVEDIRDIPPSFSLSDLQERIRSCVIHNQDHVSSGLKDELIDVKYPVDFLDFETIAPAIPIYPQTRPYQTIPFQWSDHILDVDGTIVHREYLCVEDKDPRKEFAQTLLAALGREGTIVTYTNYEEGIINGLAEGLSEYREPLFALLIRIKDLHKVIRGHYSHPGFHGSFSLKSVLPAILLEMSYENLAIQEGQLASLEYLKMIDPSSPPEDKERIRNDLLHYCGYDTIAMLEIRKELLEK
jgi:predicted RecB family nuclease